MSVITELVVETSLLQETFDRFPELVLTLEEIHPDGADGAVQHFLWVEGVDVDRFEPAVAEDSHCETVRIVTSVGKRGLCRLTLASEGRERSLYPLITDNDITILEATVRRGGAELSLRLPSRRELTAFQEGCKAQGVPYHLERIYREGGDDASRRHGLTSSQLETLLYALESGYFEVPRRTTLEQMAAALDVSDQALSARLRRGQATFLRSTLDTGTDVL